MRKLPAKILGIFTLGIASMLSFTFAVGGFQAQDTSFNPAVSGSSTLQGNTILSTVKTFVNRLLGILALVALVILIWGGFQMVTAAGNETQYKKGFKILQQAAIGLIFIGASWLIISLIFYIINLF